MNFCIARSVASADLSVRFHLSLIHTDPFTVKRVGANGSGKDVDRTVEAHGHCDVYVNVSEAEMGE